MVNVANLLTNAARQHRDRPALRYGERKMTYGELEELAARFGSALLHRGLVPGDRVALFMRNCPEYVVAMFGSFAAGLVVVPVNARLTAAEVAVVLQDSDCRALIFDEGHARTAAEADTSMVAVSVEAGSGFEALLAEGDPAHAPVQVQGETLAWLFYTSGTTGRPKGAMLSHRNLLVMTWTELADVCDYRPEDLVLHVAPLSHGSGLYLLGAIARGAENLIYDGASFDPAHVLSLVAWERVTVIAFL
ncbi:MAG: AMP-binding protein, partial [Candidatus Dormibacteraeota bacterium]|nr:AMP-binding protein [Candidatus Dormibacteraeota bacterium]